VTSVGAAAPLLPGLGTSWRNDPAEQMITMLLPTRRDVSPGA
jgi:hypothetical protein